MNEVNKFDFKNIILFFLITYIWTWSFWLFGVLDLAGVLIIPYELLRVILIIGGFGPFFSSFLLSYLRKKKVGVKKLLKKGYHYKFKKVWYLPTIFLFPVILCAGFLLGILSTGTIPDVIYYTQPWMIVLDLIWIFFLGGPFQEEFGWRGYALEKLQTRWNSLISSLILGFFWGVWHLPLFYSKTSHYGEPFLIFVAQSIILAIIFTWLYNNTGGSVLAVMIFHCMWNISIGLFPIQSFLNIIYIAIFLIITVLIIIIVYKPGTFVREQKKTK